MRNAIRRTTGPLHAGEESVPLGVEAAWNGDALSGQVRARRHVVIGDLLVAAGRAISRRARDFAAALERWHQARTTRLALQDLDDRLLRDLGFTRSEIGSVAAEIAGSAGATRSQALVGTPAPTKTPATAGVFHGRREPATRSA